MSHAEFTPTTNEFIGTAAGHTIGMVIPNIDPEVRTLLKIPEQYSSYFKNRGCRTGIFCR